MNNNNSDYIFHLNWEDRFKNAFRVGFLAQIDQTFYLIIRDEKNAESAYEKGFIGIPGFKSGEVYTSSELFDFFKNRISEKNSKNPCQELAANNGISMTDSFSVEEVAETMKEKYKEKILGIHELYLKGKQLKESKPKKAHLTNNSGESIQI